MEEVKENGMALPEGSIILEGKYRLLQLLHQRPRVNLYLAQRLHQHSDAGNQDEAFEPMVAIRELVLTDLPAASRAAVEQAAFEEFVAPNVLGSPRLPGAGDRIRIERDRHYLVMQLRQGRGEQHSFAITLDELLLHNREWPTWLNRETAINWGIQLCRIVARLHRLGLVLGDLTPSTMLVDRAGTAEWPPVLLVSWPPAPHFWSTSPSLPAPIEHYTQIFPIACSSLNNPFVAPETCAGICSERSDVYSLGALLYLLLTGYAPIAASLRQKHPPLTFSTTVKSTAVLTPLQRLELIAPRLLNKEIPVKLESILLRALALQPSKRYASVFALAEALEAIDLVNDGGDTAVGTRSVRKLPGAGRVIEWFKKRPRAR